MTNIGYRPPDAETFVKYLKRCEQNGLDMYHRLPKSSCDISRMAMTSPCVQALKECGLLRKRESLTTRETLNLCVTIRLCSIYLRKQCWHIFFNLLYQLFTCTNATAESVNEFHVEVVFFPNYLLSNIKFSVSLFESIFMIQYICKRRLLKINMVCSIKLPLCHGLLVSKH